MTYTNSPAHLAPASRVFTLDRHARGPGLVYVLDLPPMSSRLFHSVVDVVDLETGERYPASYNRLTTPTGAGW